MKLLSVTALLLASFIAFSECISFIGKRDYKDFKVGQAPSIHLNVKKHHHHNHHQSMLRGKHLDLNEVYLFYLNALLRHTCMHVYMSL
jgi:hypothetical protein